MIPDTKPRLRIGTLLLSIAIASTFAASIAWAQNWPQWRGPQRDGRISEEVVPESWPATLTKAWSVEVGAGHASPISVGERVYVFSRRGEEETLTAHELSTGEEIWSSGYLAPYLMNPAASGHGKGPKSTPVFAQGRVFTLGISGVLSAWKAIDGELLWQHRFDDQFDRTSPTYGSAMSPLVDSDRIIVHVGGKGRGALIAFETASGKSVWSWENVGPGYASPVVAEFSGVRQLVTQTQTSIVGVELTEGRLLWRLPLETPWEQNCVTPVVEDDTVIYSGLDQGTVAVHPRLTDRGWSVDEVWESAETSFYMSTPVLTRGRLCGLRHQSKGQLVCMDPTSGAVLWASSGRLAENAAVLAAGDWLLALTEGAVLTVLRADADFYEPIASYEVASSPTWAHPVVVRGGVIIKDKTHLTLHNF